MLASPASHPPPGSRLTPSGQQVCFAGGGLVALPGLLQTHSCGAAGVRAREMAAHICCRARPILTI